MSLKKRLKQEAEKKTRTNGREASCCKGAANETIKFRTGGEGKQRGIGGRPSMIELPGKKKKESKNTLITKPKKEERRKRSHTEGGGFGRRK